MQRPAIVINYNTHYLCLQVYVSQLNKPCAVLNRYYYKPSSILNSIHSYVAVESVLNKKSNHSCSKNTILSEKIIAFIQEKE